MVALSALLIVSLGASAGAQSAVPARGRPDATRAELQARVDEAERQAATLGLSAEEKKRLIGEAAEKRARLREGDFRVGDRIVMEMVNPAVGRLPDTLTVRGDGVVDIPKVDTVSLRGVLASELEPRLLSKLAQEYVNPQIRVTRLMTVLISGAVGRQGTVPLRSDDLLAVAIVQAGGFTGTADLKRISVRRNDEVLYKEGELVALSHTSSLDQLGIRSGDEIHVGERKQTNSLTVIQTAAAVVSVIAGLYGATRLFRR